MLTLDSKMYLIVAELSYTTPSSKMYSPSTIMKLVSNTVITLVSDKQSLNEKDQNGVGSLNNTLILMPAVVTIPL